MSNDGDLIEQLKDLREEIHWLRGMVNMVKRYEHTAISAEKRIDATLYDLTGEEFYRPKEDLASAVSRIK